jgi:hypothetical protein
MIVVQRRAERSRERTDRSTGPANATDARIVE